MKQITLPPLWHTDSAFTTLAVENGQVDMAAVTTAYNQLLDSIRQHYYGLTATDKQFVFANVELIPSGLKTSEVTLKVTSGVGEESDGTTGLFFGPNDYWAWGGSDYSWPGGYCDGPYAGLQPNSDAAKQIQQKVRLRLSSPGPNYYYTDYEYKTIDGFDSPLYPGGSTNYCNTYVFVNRSSDAGYHTCLCPYEMNHYLNCAWTIADSYNLGYHPVGKHLVNISMGSDFICSGTTVIFHIETMTYAIAHQRIENPIDL